MVLASALIFLAFVLFRQVFMAPELFDDALPASGDDMRAVDVYALAVTVWQLWFKKASVLSLQHGCWLKEASPRLFPHVRRLHMWRVTHFHWGVHHMPVCCSLLSAKAPFDQKPVAWIIAKVLAKKRPSLAAADDDDDDDAGSGGAGTKAVCSLYCAFRILLPALPPAPALALAPFHECMHPPMNEP
jgi:hypothetical protein